MEQKLIYMPLLNEGTDVLRPVMALHVRDDVYKIMGTKEGLKPEDLDEDWLFPIGSYVSCITKRSAKNMILVADRNLQR